jgi:hypothetical protein
MTDDRVRSNTQQDADLHYYPSDRQEASPMMVGFTEGTTWRFEVVEHPDGYVVQSRDLMTSTLDGSEQRLFRTTVAALAFADLSAVLDKAAAARLDGELAPNLVAELDIRNSAFREVSERLFDTGSEADILLAWQAHDESEGRRLH